MNNNLDKLNNSVNNSIGSEPMSTVEAQPMPTVEAQSMPTVEAQVSNDEGSVIPPMNNINKDEVMEEALSHTNKYSPFEAPKQEVNKEEKKTSNRNAYILIIVIFVIMLLFIIFLPQISKLFGW